MIVSHRPSASPHRIAASRTAPSPSVPVDPAVRIKQLEDEVADLRAVQQRLVALCHAKGLLPADIAAARRGGR